MNGISVIVCCYNSSLKLLLTLEHLSKQRKGPDLDWEVIIVDNNSSDNTADVALKLWGSSECEKKIRIVHELKPGLSFARQTGVEAAFYDIIIFCDDDNLLAENYLQYAFELVNSTKETYGVWGGKTVACFDEDVLIPEWFEKEKLNYVVGAQGVVTGDISDRGYIWGAGMIILKKIYLSIVNENFPMLLQDRAGANLTSGGDSEISLRSLIIGYKLYYDEKLVLKHYISRDKLTPAYNAGLIKGFAASNEILNKYKIYLHYICDKDLLHRLYCSLIYSGKYLLDKTGLRRLTVHDETVLHALFSNRFNDNDFNLMYRLSKQRIKI
jgi:glycosyltransferase involved in cell wall biosynthesis